MGDLRSLDDARLKRAGERDVVRWSPSDDELAAVVRDGVRNECGHHVVTLNVADSNAAVLWALSADQAELLGVTLIQWARDVRRKNEASHG